MLDATLPEAIRKRTANSPVNVAWLAASYRQDTTRHQPRKEHGMLNDGRTAARLPAQDLKRARAFYADKLGLHPVEERDGGLRYLAAAGEFALFESAGTASGAHTQMAWEVDDIEATVADLRSRGVVFEEYDLPGLKTVDGIAEIEGNYPSKGTGERGAWFRDSEGNVLGIGQPVRAEADALERLDVLIGRWKTEGRVIDSADRIDAVDTYERLPGGALLHLVDARVGTQKIDGAEIIGYDPARASYVTQYFGSEGTNAYEASLYTHEEALVWTMRSDKDRFTGTFNDERDLITGHWEALDDDDNWQPWMHVTLTKEAS
jgi:catechol 2,3-dioxygenase-like lactoylglutathione lyase family enzyme